MSPKRKLPPTPDLSDFTLGDVPAELRRQGQDLAAAVILKLIHDSGLTVRDLVKHETERPSFASATWQDIAVKFKLEASKGANQLELFSYPVASLPPSFHREVMKASAKWLDVYQEVDAHNREAARVRLMDAWHVPICSLFKGRLVDRPESSMPETPETSGGQVEHEVYMIEGIILLVVEMKLALKSKGDHVAQVLLELVCEFQPFSHKNFKAEKSSRIQD
ncbi:hypothetical protein D9615_007367 [Tricholomella constricta]|uniref:Uncharacterized protein n=1 Tax=Tricholomella constricta TaxID=117010 RepID=A0A8H5LXQ0_9AGAR|nr:hypothetical protein D9615_007367 [Tricholomella constricta]